MKEGPLFQALAEYLRGLGALELTEERYSRSFLVWTRAGAAVVRPYDGFINVRFDYPELAARILGDRVNPHTGKYNYHPERLDYSVEQFVEGFRQHMSYVLEGGR